LLHLTVAENLNGRSGSTGGIGGEKTGNPALRCRP
jgi:hypothetical protein